MGCPTDIPRTGGAFLEIVPLLLITLSVPVCMHMSGPCDCEASFRQSTGNGETTSAASDKFRPVAGALAKACVRTKRCLRMARIVAPADWQASGAPPSLQQGRAADCCGAAGLLGMGSRLLRSLVAVPDTPSDPASGQPSHPFMVQVLAASRV